MLQNRKICFEDIITIYENTDGCIEQYIFNISLYLLSMLAHKYNFITYCGVGSPGHGRDVVDGLNAASKKLTPC